jgi:hypothetical protein
MVDTDHREANFSHGRTSPRSLATSWIAEAKAVKNAGARQAWRIPLHGALIP